MSVNSMYYYHQNHLGVNTLVDYIFQMQVIGGHWFVAVVRMIMTGLEGERVGSDIGLYGVYVVLQVDWIM